MKSGRVHRVPLSKQALRVLRSLDWGDDEALIFRGRDVAQLSAMVFLMTIRRMGRKGLTAHGFRSTFRDWVAETTDFANEVAEAALAHVVGDRTEAAYRRGDLFEKRRRLMQDWADYCLGGPSIHAASEIR
jgi:integrase